jgi:CIC family chloride channel protein
MQLLTVADAMQPLPASVSADAPLNEVIRRLTELPADGLPVIDGDGVYRGTVTSLQIEQAMRENALDACAGDLAQDVPPLYGRQSLEDALGALLRARSGLPVVAGEAARPIGWLTHADVLHAYSDRLERGIGQASASSARASQAPTSAGLSGYRVVDVELATSQHPVGRCLDQLALPDRSAVLAIRRDGRSFEPDPDEELAQGDRLTLLLPATEVVTLVDVMRPRDVDALVVDDV